MFSIVQRSLLVLAVVSGANLAHAEVVKVTSTEDEGPGTFRAALEAANADPSQTDIVFDIPLGSTDVPTGFNIFIKKRLPVVNSPVVIDGATQPVAKIFLFNAVENHTAPYLLELSLGSSGSVIKNLNFRTTQDASGIFISDGKILIEKNDFAALGFAISVWDHEWGWESGQMDDITIQYNNFTNTAIRNDGAPKDLSFIGNTLTYARFASGLPTTGCTRCRFEKNAFSGDGLPSAIYLTHSMDGSFIGNDIEGYQDGIRLSVWATYFAGPNLIEANTFTKVGNGIVISGIHNRNSRATRNVITENTGEPLRLATSTPQDHTNPNQPNYGKGRPDILSAVIAGPPGAEVVTVKGTTLPTVDTKGNDTIELFVAGPDFTYDQPTEFLRVESREYVTSFTANGTAWLASFPLSQFPSLQAGEYLTVTATDTASNTSEYAVPHKLVQRPWLPSKLPKSE